jgi:hypothetical protein
VQLVMRIAGEADALAGRLAFRSQLSSSVKTSISADGPEPFFGGGQTLKKWADAAEILRNESVQRGAVTITRLYSYRLSSEVELKSLPGGPSRSEATFS